jgi:hypothetical protein
MCHFFITWYIWKDPTRLIPGPIGDNTCMLWNIGWVKHALDRGSLGYWFTNAYYPEGFMTLYGTHTWLDGLLYWMFSPLLPAGVDGTVLWANINLLLSTVASGLLLILSLRAWGIGNWSVLLLVSSATVFSWFRMFAMMGHYHFYGTQWMLLALCLLSLGRQRISIGHISAGNRFFIAAGLALGVAFLNDQALTVFAAILGGLLLLGLPQAGLTMKQRGKQLFGAAARYYGFSVIPASIHLVPIIVAAIKGKLVYRVDIQGPRLVDATSLILPPDFHFLGRSLAGLRQQFGLFWSEGTYLGIIPMCLLILATIASLRFLLHKDGERPAGLRVCFYATGAAWIFVVCAMGDKLVLGREQIITFPGRILKELPILHNIRLPQRWIWPAHLCIALAGATALNYIVTTFNRRWIVWVPAVLAIVPPIEGKAYPTPQPLDLRTHAILEPMPVVEAVKRHYKSGGVLVMPLSEAFSRGNILQVLWGFDIPLTFSFTARLPFLVEETPVKDDFWSEADGEWLKAKQVMIVVFPLDDEGPVRMADWIKQARANIPGLIVLNRHGEEI